MKVKSSTKKSNEITKFKNKTKLTKFNKIKLN